MKEIEKLLSFFKPQNRYYRNNNSNRYYRNFGFSLLKIKQFI
jgi:hypothetical protein